jgi:hypothetical protein
MSAPSSACRPSACRKAASAGRPERRTFRANQGPDPSALVSPKSGEAARLPRFAGTGARDDRGGGSGRRRRLKARVWRVARPPRLPDRDLHSLSVGDRGRASVAASARHDERLRLRGGWAVDLDSPAAAGSDFCVDDRVVGVCDRLRDPEPEPARFSVVGWDRSGLWLVGLCRMRSAPDRDVPGAAGTAFAGGGSERG